MRAKKGDIAQAGIVGQDFLEHFGLNEAHSFDNHEEHWTSGEEASTSQVGYMLVPVGTEVLSRPVDRRHKPILNSDHSLVGVGLPKVIQTTSRQKAISTHP